MPILHLLPAYSLYANDEQLRRAGLQGAPWRLAVHQLETYQALCAGEFEVIFHTALAGDGKSLAGQLPSLLDPERRPLLALYPNAGLLCEQAGRLPQTAAHWKTPLLPTQLDGPRLETLLADEAYERRSQALLHVLGRSPAVLSDADLFHYLLQQFYRRPEDAPERLLGPLLQRFCQFTVDDFHLFEAPQAASLLNALLFLNALQRPACPPRFLFLSAAPAAGLPAALQRAGLRVYPVQGQYLHTRQPVSDPAWRQIFHAAELRFASQTVEAWVEANLESVLLPFFTRREPGSGGARGALLVNSIAAAHRLLQRLQPVCQAHGLRLALHSGLGERAMSRPAYEADLWIGTSLLDVGLDFPINFLVFESPQAGSFLQCLGRLGRQAGYLRQGEFVPFTEHVGVALLPAWVQDSLFQGQPQAAPLLQDGQECDRQALTAAIQQAFPPPVDFLAYARRWGQYQSAHLLGRLYHPPIRQQYSGVRQVLQQRIEAALQISMRSALEAYRQLRREKRAVWDEAVSLQGESLFNVCLVDESESGPGRFKNADFFQVAFYAGLQALSQDDFYRLAGQAGVCARSLCARQPLAFYRLEGWKARRTPLSFFLEMNLAGQELELYGRLQVLSDLTVIAALPGLAELNRRLRLRRVPAVLCPGQPPQELRRRLHLPETFALYSFTSRDAVHGSLAFSRQALLLHTCLAG